jgi:mono/diheme cytochrome c family protein
VCLQNLLSVAGKIRKVEKSFKGKKFCTAKSEASVSPASPLKPTSPPVERPTGARLNGRRQVSGGLCIHVARWRNGNTIRLSSNRRAAVEGMAMRAIWSGVLIAASIAIGMTDVEAQGIEYGKNDYVKFCVQCHGETGKGDGKFAKSLKRPPADLTKLSENNGGVFPTSRIYDVIDGRIEVMNHGKRDMPVWGNVFTDELTARLPRDSMSKESSDYLVRRRILSIIEYISTLQGK